MEHNKKNKDPFLLLAQNIAIADKYAAIVLNLPIKEEFLLAIYSLIGSSGKDFSLWIGVNKPAYFWQFYFKKRLEETISHINSFTNSYIKNYSILKEVFRHNRSNKKEVLSRFVANISRYVTVCKNVFKETTKEANEFLNEIEISKEFLVNLDNVVGAKIQVIQLSIQNDFSEIALIEKNILSLEQQLVNWSSQFEEVTIGIAIGLLNILSGDFFGFFFIIASIVWLGIISWHINDINSNIAKNKSKKKFLINQINSNNRLLNFLIYIKTKLDNLISQGNNVVEIFTSIKDVFFGIFDSLNEIEMILKDLRSDLEQEDLDYIEGTITTLNEEFVQMQAKLKHIKNSLNIPIQSTKNLLWTPNKLSFNYTQLNYLSQNRIIRN